MTIRGPTERNPPLVCGTLTGQHSMYSKSFYQVLTPVFIIIESIIVRNTFAITIIIMPLVYVETGFEDGASTRIQFNINGDIIGLRKWKVF